MRGVWVRCKVPLKAVIHDLQCEADRNVYRYQASLQQAKQRLVAGRQIVGDAIRTSTTRGPVGAATKLVSERSTVILLIVVVYLLVREPIIFPGVAWWALRRSPLMWIVLGYMLKRYQVRRSSCRR